MLLQGCRYLALTYAIGLAIGEAVMNSSREHWQYAPLWVIDYLIVAYLLAGFWASRRARNVPVLMSAYGLSAGVMYLAFFVNLDPGFPEEAKIHGVAFPLLGTILLISVAGLVGSTLVWLRQEWARSPTDPR